MHRLKRYILPDEAGIRAYTLRQEALLLYAVFLFVLQFSLQYVANRFPGILGFASNITVNNIVDMTNRRRGDNGLNSLSTDGNLSAAAEQKARDMFEKGYWAHVSPDGTKPWSFITQNGYGYLYAGENLAKDFQNSNDVVEAWLASPSHRDNLLSNRYSDIGVAVVNGTLNGFETTLVVQMFGTRQGSPAVAYAAPAKESPKSALAATEKTPVRETVPAPKPEPRPQPKTATGPTLELPLSAVPPSAFISALPKYLAEGTNQPLIPVVDVLKIAKSVSFAFGFFLLALFAVDGLIVLRRRHLRLSGHSLAHITILLLLLGATWYTGVGTIL